MGGEALLMLAGVVETLGTQEDASGACCMQAAGLRFLRVAARELYLSFNKTVN